MIGMIGHAERIIFCEGPYTRKHVVPELCACIKVCAPHTGTTIHRLMYADDIMIYAVSPHFVVAMSSAWYNAPWFFSLGATTVDWMRRTCCSAVLADRCSGDIKHAMRHRADCLNTYCKNMAFSIKWYVYNCLYSIPTLTGEHFHLRITHKRHVSEYMFLHKKWSSLHGLSSLSFCRWGPVTLCIKF